MDRNSGLSDRISGNFLKRFLNSVPKIPEQNDAQPHMVSSTHKNRRIHPSSPLRELHYEGVFTLVKAGLQAVTWKNIGINIGHFSEKYRTNIGKSSKI